MRKVRDSYLFLVILFMVIGLLICSCAKKPVQLEDELGGDILDTAKSDSEESGNPEADSDSDSDDKSDGGGAVNNDSTNNDSKDSSPADGDNGAGGGKEQDDNTGDEKIDNGGSSEAGLDTGGGTKISILFQNVLMDGRYDGNRNPRWENNEGTETSWTNRRPRLKQVVSSYNADSMGFTEVTWGQKAHLAEDFPGYTQVGVMRYGDDYAGNESNELDLLMYKNSVFIALETGTLWLSDKPTVIGSKSWGGTNPATVTYAFLKHRKTGEVIIHCTTHFSHDSDLAKLKSGPKIVEFFEEWLEDDPGIPIYASGDYNILPDSEPYSEIVMVLTDPIGIAKKKKASTDKMFTLPTLNQKSCQPMTPYKRVDFIFINEENMVVDLFEVIEKTIDGLPPSDHYGLYLESRIYPFK